MTRFNIGDFIINVKTSNAGTIIAAFSAGPNCLRNIYIIDEADDDNYIIIDEDFVYTRDIVNGESIDLPEIRTQKIGYNSSAIRKKNLFEDGVKPALILEPGMSKSELENTAAIRRKANGSSKREE